MCAFSAAGANFTTVLHEHGCCANASARAAALAWCAQHGLDVIIKTDATGGGGDFYKPPISTSPAFLGVNVKDEPEPSSSEFQTLRKITDYIHAKAPGKLAFINMCATITPS